MRFKMLFLALVTLCLVGCVSEGFTAVGDAISNYFGANTPDGTQSEATKTFGTIGPLLPGGMGVALLWIAKVAHCAIRAKKALFESTTQAISDGTLAEASTEEEVKSALKKAQQAHDDSKLLSKVYDKYKNGGIITKAVKKLRSILA